MYNQQINPTANNTALESLVCYDNQLTILDVSNNTALGNLYIGNMSTLSEVCVWTMPFPPEGFRLCAEGSPNVYFTMDCL